MALFGPWPCLPFWMHAILLHRFVWGVDFALPDVCFTVRVGANTLALHVEYLDIDIGYQKITGYRLCRRLLDSD